MKTVLFLLKDLSDLSSQHDSIQVENITNDSRAVTKNTLFIAYLGEKFDARKYIVEAASKGACAIAYEASDDFVLPVVNVPCIAVKDLKVKQSTIAARFYDFPSKKVPVIGVTGTNGKTSITHFVAQALSYSASPLLPQALACSLSQLQECCGIIGTLGYGFLSHLTKTPNTTPDGLQLQKIFAELISQGAQTIAMEVSSHALAQGRVNDVQFHTAVFTNLTQDHLDYHGTMENYRDAKALLFEQPGLKNAVINIDDEVGRYYVEKYGDRGSGIGDRLNIVTYSMQNNNADIFVEKCTSTECGFDLTIKTPWGNSEFYLPLIGEFNISNVLAVIGVLYSLFEASDRCSVSDHLFLALSKLHAVSGRMQLLKTKNSPSVIVDYAHTPDALEKTLQSIHSHCTGKLICVFGCGGDRDKTKRPIMGAIAAKLSDHVIITNDNPRTENPEVIAQEILQGITRNNYTIELDRRVAIEKAIQSANKNDWVLIAGKGHETEQIIGDKVLSHSDVSCVLALLE